MTNTREDAALALDAEPDAALRRDDFLLPPASGGDFPLTAYLAGNSLGLQPRATRDEVLADLAAWEHYGVQGHLRAHRPWLKYHEDLREPAARLVGALPREVVAMNSLTVNLHLLLASFYRPTAIRHRIVIEDRAFSSDSYTVRSHVAFRGYDPDTAVLRIKPRPGEDVLRTEDVLKTLEDHAHSIATVMIGGVNYLTGEVMDMAAITAGTSLMLQATSPSTSMSGTSTSPRGARTSTSTPGPEPLREPSSTSGTWRMRSCRDSRDGGAPSRSVDSRCTRSPILRRAPMPGRCRIRRFSPWRRSRRRSSTSPRPACRPCAGSRSR